MSAERLPPDVDDPAALAASIAALAARPLLVGLDIDGVLSPIVEHADDAALLPGVIDDLVALASVTPVAIVSGRELETIDRLFALPDDVIVVGTHGVERRGAQADADDVERERLARLSALAETAAARSGEGAWVEYKGLAVALHTRQAREPGRAVESAAWLTHAAEQVDGTTVKLGHHVVELLVRPAAKSAAVRALRAETSAQSVIFVGDDVTDEEVFATLGGGDWSIRVGGGATSAEHRLAEPADVRQLLQHLARLLAVGRR